MVCVQGVAACVGSQAQEVSQRKVTTFREEGSFYDMRHPGIGVSGYYRKSLQFPNKDGSYMRTVFSIDMKVDLDSNDTETAQLFLELCKQAAQQLFAQASMLTKKGKAPQIMIKSTDTLVGQRDIEVFDGETLADGTSATGDDAS